jgi:hypothetical protein
MAATIKIGRVEITVETFELGEALRQLEPWMSPGLIPPSLWTRQTAHRSSSRPTVAAPQNKPPAGVPQAEFDDGEFAGSHDDDEAGTTPSLPEGGTHERAIKLLRAIKESNAGVRMAQVQSLVEASHPKGIGSRMQSINKLLVDLGFSSDSVYRNDRGPLGERVWTSGERIAEAISALEKHATF